MLFQYFLANKLPRRKHRCIRRFRKNLENHKNTGFDRLKGRDIKVEASQYNNIQEILPISMK